MMDLSVVPYESKRDAASSPPGVLAGGDLNYRECMRNHAASLGGQAFDGCGEFMPSSDDALKCAACGCHRNFHRRDGGGCDPRRPLLISPPPATFPAYFPSPYARMPPPPLAAQPARLGSETPPRMDGGDGSRKRNRTKFTAEQKEKMQAFAERLGWRIQKHDDGALEEFCGEIGVKRHVLKVWMHNNKSHLSTTTVGAAGGGGGSGGKSEVGGVGVPATAEGIRV